MITASRALFTGLVCVLTVSQVRAAESRHIVPATPQCLIKAAESQKIPITIMLALIKTEGGRPGLESAPNSDGSRDLGVMQINDRVWVPKLARMTFGGDRKLARATIRDDGCYNMLIGAWVYRGYVDEAGGDWARAAGYYNSHTPKHMAAYQKRVAASFVRVLREMRQYYNQGLAR